MIVATDTLQARPLGQLDPSTGLGAEWEALVAGSPESGVMQSLYWAAVRAEAGSSALHIGLFNGDELIGGVLWHGAAPGVQPAILMAPDGPVLPWDEPSLARAGLHLLIEATREAASELSVVSLRIEPRLPLPVPKMLRDFVRAPVDICPAETLYLELAPSADELLASMAGKWRYNIRLAERHGVTVREDSSPAAISKLYNVLRDASGRAEFFLEPMPFFAALNQHLVQNGLARVLLAERDGELLGAMLLVTFGDRATYLYGGTSNDGRQLMGGYALQWAAILAGKAAGCSTYDFYGFEPYGDPDHLFAGFSRFKRGFGGRAMRFIGAHELVLVDSLADAIVRLMASPRGGQHLRTRERTNV